MAVLGFEHVGIQVENIEKSIKFYQEVVGIELIDQYLHPDGDKRLAFLGLNNEIIVEFIEGYNANLPVEGKVHHIAFKVKDIESEQERLEDAGVVWINKEITILPTGSKYMFFRGPDQEWIEFFEN